MYYTAFQTFRCLKYITLLAPYFAFKYLHETPECGGSCFVNLVIDEDQVGSETVFLNHFMPRNDLIDLIV